MLISYLNGLSDCKPRATDFFGDDSVNGIDASGAVARRPADSDSMPVRLIWAAGRWLVMAATLLVLAGLWYRPEPTLTILWGLLIPILPASFFITPQWWRGVCPLATTNQWFGTRFGKAHLAGRWLALGNTLGIVLLSLMVPARHLVFNENGPVLALTIGAIVVAAAAMGTVFDARAGFCNSICPVLPVERLYGQRPLVQLDNFRCHPCVHCIGKGCLEIDQPKSIQYAVRPSDGSTHWLATSYGVFAASLPGFIVGYFTTGDIPAAEIDVVRDAGMVYGWIAACSLVSYGVTALIVRLGGMTRETTLVLLAATAGFLYYWWGAPLIARTLQLPADAAWPARLLFFLLVALWYVRARQHVTLQAAG
jgi:hypothetical protein